jgi:hypothetical protein
LGQGVSIPTGSSISGDCRQKQNREQDKSHGLWQPWTDFDHRTRNRFSIVHLAEGEGVYHVSTFIRRGPWHTMGKMTMEPVNLSKNIFVWDFGINWTFAQLLVIHSNMGKHFAGRNGEGRIAQFNN